MLDKLFLLTAHVAETLHDAPRPIQEVMEAVSAAALPGSGVITVPVTDGKGNYYLAALEQCETPGTGAIAMTCAVYAKLITEPPTDIRLFGQNINPTVSAEAPPADTPRH